MQVSFAIIFFLDRRRCCSSQGMTYQASHFRVRFQCLFILLVSMRIPRHIEGDQHVRPQILWIPRIGSGNKFRIPIDIRFVPSGAGPSQSLLVPLPKVACQVPGTLYHFGRVFVMHEAAARMPSLCAGVVARDSFSTGVAAGTSGCGTKRVVR